MVQRLLLFHGAEFDITVRCKLHLPSLATEKLNTNTGLTIVAAIVTVPTLGLIDTATLAPFRGSDERGKCPR
jgi:hypothetical protein